VHGDPQSMSTPVRQLAARDLGAGRWRVELDLAAARCRAHPDAVAVLSAAGDTAPAEVESVLCDARRGRLSVVLAVTGRSDGSAPELRLRGGDGWLADVALGTAPQEPTPPASPVRPSPQGEADFRGRDFQALRATLLGLVAGRIGDGLQVHPVAETTALVELMAYLGDALSYSQDAVATEAYLATARRRVSVTRHAALLDYRVFEGRSARLWAQLKVDAPVRLPAGTRLLSRVPGLASRVASADLDGALRAGALVFETCAPVELRPRRTLALARRQHPDGRLAPAATAAVVETADEPPPEPGTLATIGPAADAPPGPGHVVRLSAVRHLRHGVLVQWSEQDALPAEVAGLAPLCLRPGNLVLADHGRTLPWTPLQLFGEGPVPWPELPHGNPSMVLAPTPPGGAAPDPPAPPGGRDPADHPTPPREHAAASARALLGADGPTRPAVVLRESQPGWSRLWTQRGSLLDSGPLAADYVVELEEDRTARLRFGDGSYGLAPDPRSAFAVKMRTGSGLDGAIAAGRLAHVLSDDPRVLAVTNPAAAAGAADPEPLSGVRLLAPRTFRSTDRALTAADLIGIARGVSGVADADATIDQTGVGPLARVAIATDDPRLALGGLTARVHAAIAPRQPLGVGLQVRGARPLAVAVEAEIAVLAGWSLAALSAEIDALVRRELLEPSRRRFGMGLYRSQVVSLLAGIPGVLDVTLPRFGWARSDPAAPQPQALLPPFGAILQIAQDPAAPWRGLFSFRLRSAQ